MRRSKPDQLIKHVGHRIAELRTDAGLTQEELAESIETATKNLQQIEYGKVNMTLRTVARLANALGVEPAELLVKPTRKAARRPGRPKKS